MVVVAAVRPLQALRPGPLPSIQETYLSTLEAQVLATVGIVLGVVLGFWIARLGYPSLRRRYGVQVAEATTVAAIGVLVAGSVYALSVVWHVTYVLAYTLETVQVDRFTAAHQLVTVALVAVAYLAIRFVNRSIDKLSETDAITTHQREVAYHVTDVAIVLGTASLILTIWGVDLTNIFIGAGAVTAIVALTARQTLAAMLAGFILLFSRPFRVGDWIEVNDTTGIVTDVTIFTTKIQTFTEKHVLVPNDEITDSQLINYSENDQLRVDVEIGVDYDTDLERARAVVIDAVEDLEEIRTSPDPQVVARRFGDSAIVLELQLWIGDPTRRRQLDAQTAAIQAVTERFEREGIEIPFPQRVHAPRGDDGFPITEGSREGLEVGQPTD
ncbi:mechanosensitive ion channel family protein [Saliphagus sp. GCM10025334]